MATTEIVPAERLTRAARAFDPRALEADLARALDGDVLFDDASRALYAQDASNYRLPPIGVVLPRSRADLARAIDVCRAHQAPITLRGGGTGLAGQTTNRAVVIDVSRYLTKILGFDPARRRARVEPGLICDDLVKKCKPHGLTFGPKPATHDRCCFGGMISNNCGGMEAQINGSAVNNVEAMNVVLYDGTSMSFGWMDEEDLGRAIRDGGRAGEVYARLRALRDNYATLIRERYPKLPRRVSGYNLDQLLPGPDGRFNVARALVGSEGTLVTMLDVTVLLVPVPKERLVVVIGYDDLGDSGDAVAELLVHRPTKLEGMDSILRDQIKKKGGRSARFEGLLPRGEAWLFVEIGGATKDEARARAEDVVRTARGQRVVDVRVLDDECDQQHVWEVREGALGATSFIPGEPDAWPGWEDSAVPPERLGEYLRELRDLMRRHGMHASLYGHFGMGCVHNSLPFDLRSHHGVADFRRFVGEAAELVVRLGGSLSGEHGDGQARAELLDVMFGKEIVGAFRAFKTIFDPQNKMNPGRIVDPDPLDTNLRIGPSYTPRAIDTHFRYPNDGGNFSHATLRCIGIGRCRRTEASGEYDTMCPSYMVTHEERHSTRGRAHLLFEMQRSDSVVSNGWQDEGVKEALDLCLACKGCKADCPVSVDVATYKAEFLSHYYEKRKRPRHAWAFGLIDVWARLAALSPGLVNLATQLPGVSALAKLAAGVSLDARIPPFAPRTFRSMFRARARRPRERKVVLWPDTFNDHFMPDTLMSAVTVLEAAGYEVLVPSGHLCCGRPLYDYGLLDRAKRYLEKTMRALAPYVEAGHPIVVLEPSCASVFRDELTNLFAAREDAARLAERVVVLSELLDRDGFEVPPLGRKALVQGHCHHKAVMSFEAEKKVLGRTGLDWKMSDGGCCGMAGAFGYLAGTRDVGVACGERVLLPKVREADRASFVIADGFSCREQIAQHTDRRALHLADVLRIALEGSVTTPPEAPIARAREADVRRSMWRAAGAITALAGLAAFRALARRLLARAG